MTEQANQSQTIDVKKAVSAARNYIQSLESEMGAPLKDLLLEEVELTENERFWLITLGFSYPKQYKKNLFDPSPTLQEERKYKIIKVSAETGEVESMKIREL